MSTFHRESRDLKHCCNHPSNQFAVNASFFFEATSDFILRQHPPFWLVVISFILPAANNEPRLAVHQGCQMVHFQTKIAIWVNFGGSSNGRCWSILWTFGLFVGHLSLFGIFCGNLLHFSTFWYIVPGKFYILGHFFHQLIWSPWLRATKKKTVKSGLPVLAGAAERKPSLFFCLGKTAWAATSSSTNAIVIYMSDFILFNVIAFDLNYYN
jgi:hypothetical protein